MTIFPDNDTRHEALQSYFEKESEKKHHNTFVAKLANKRNKKSADHHYNSILCKSGFFAEQRVINMREKLRDKLEERKLSKVESTNTYLSQPNLSNH